MRPSPVRRRAARGARRCPLAAQDHADPDQAAAGGGTVPAGWTVRADKGDAKARRSRPWARVSTSPRARPSFSIAPTPRGAAPFHTLATFTQTKPSKHAEGYGLFVGGQELDGAGQKYLYFLVRQDGSYLIKRRDGEKTTDVSKGWVRIAAVKKPDGKGSGHQPAGGGQQARPEQDRFPGERAGGLRHRREGHGAGRRSSGSGRTTTSTCTSRVSTSTAERVRGRRQEPHAARLPRAGWRGSGSGRGPGRAPPPGARAVRRRPRPGADPPAGRSSGP